MKKLLIIVGWLAVAVCFAAPSIVVTAGSVRTSNEAYVTVTGGSIINPTTGSPFYAVNTKPCSALTLFRGPEGLLDALSVNPSGDMGSTTVTVYSGSYHPDTATSVLHWWDVNPTTLQQCSLTFRFRNGYLGALTLANLAVYERSAGTWVKLSETITGSNVGAAFTDVTFSGVNFVNAKGPHPIILADKNDGTLPVELSYFNGVALQNGHVGLQWVSQTETGMLGYYVWRSDDDYLASAQVISPLVEATNSSSQTMYSFTDSEVLGSGTYSYWLQSVDIDGSEHFFGSVMITISDPTPPIPPIPLETKLNKLYPNPFNPDLHIAYSLKDASTVNFNVYNSRGQVIRSMAQGNKQPGNYTLYWDGRDDSGGNCSSGVYYIRMQTSKESFIQKALLMK